jgi:hypothetical protein
LSEIAGWDGDCVFFVLAGEKKFGEIVTGVLDRGKAGTRESVPKVPVQARLELLGALPRRIAATPALADCGLRAPS